MNKLFKIAGATPFLLAVFLNAFVDLGHKIVIQNTIFKLYDGQEQVVLTAIVNGLILLPFILLFSPAGFISDRFPKNQVMRYSAWAAVGLTLAITGCYLAGWFWAAFAMTFLLAVQSAIYSPAKYGYLKGFFGKQNLAQANGIVQAISIVAILAGTLLMSVLFEMWYPEGTTTKSEVLQGLVPIGVLLVIGSVIELVMMYRLPAVDQGNTQQFDIKDYARGKLLQTNLKPVLSRDVIRLSIIGLAMFWSIGQVLLASFPAFAKEQMGETNTLVIQAIIAATGIGIALGSTLASRASRNYIETGLIPLGAAGIALGLWLLPTLQSPWMMGLDFLLIGTMGGLFIVPLNAMIQFYAGDHELGKVLAANNLIQNVGMLGFLVLTAVFALLGISSKQLLVITAIFAVVGGVYTVYKLPQSLVRFLLTYMMSRHYRINVQGMKHTPETGGVLLLGNHISWIDWAIVQIAYPRPVQFVMLKSIYERWYLKWFFDLFGCVPIEPGAGSQQSLDIVTELLDQGKVVCLFPEGAISRNGHLGEFRRGFERAAQKAGSDLVIQPFYIRGLWGSQFSRSSDKLKSLRSRSRGRDLIVSFGEPMDKNTTADVLKRRVFDLSIDSWDDYARSLPNLAHAWIGAIKQHPGDMIAANIKDQQHKASSVSGLEALVSARRLSKHINQLAGDKNIGVLLPPSIDGALANMAILMSGKTAVNIDPSLLPQHRDEMIQTTRLSALYTTRDWIDQLERSGCQVTEYLAGLKIYFIDDINQQRSTVADQASRFAFRLLPVTLLQTWLCRKTSPLRTAFIAFHINQQGALEGVKLSHKNISANIKQLSDVLNLQDTDVALATEPLHETAGLITSVMMPLIEAIPIIGTRGNRDPLVLAKSIARYRATLMCTNEQHLASFIGTEKLHPLMLDSLRVIIGLPDTNTHDIERDFSLHFNKTVFSAYRASTVAPITAINLPDAIDFNDWKVQRGAKPNSLGMPLPGCSIKVVDAHTQKELNSNETGQILIGGVPLLQPFSAAHESRNVWLPTDDVGSLDQDGFLSLRPPITPALTMTNK